MSHTIYLKCRKVHYMTQVSGIIAQISLVACGVKNISQHRLMESNVKIPSCSPVGCLHLQETMHAIS